jgi:ankyrin repeat protein
MKLNKCNWILFILVLITTAGTLLSGELYDKVEQNDIEAVKNLLAEGADIDEQVEVGGAGTMTPLLAACFYRYDDMAKLLISKGADINIKTATGQTPLMFACYHSEEIAKLLVSKGAEINVKDGTGAFSICISAIMDGGVSTTLAEFLLSKGANVDETNTSGPVAGYTCLMIAARNKKPELVKFLIKNKANVNAKAKDGSTPLSMAMKENDAAMIKLLKEFGAKE